MADFPSLHSFADDEQKEVTLLIKLCVTLSSFNFPINLITFFLINPKIF